MSREKFSHEVFQSGQYSVWLEGFTRVPSSPLRVVRRRKSLSLTSNNNRNLDRTARPLVHRKDLLMICSLLEFKLHTTGNQK
jgi:hypothetical protein